MVRLKISWLGHATLDDEDKLERASTKEGVFGPPRDWGVCYGESNL